MRGREEKKALGKRERMRERDALGLLSNPNPKQRNRPIPPSTRGRIKVMLSSGGDERAKKIEEKKKYRQIRIFITSDVIIKK